jgi:hypothetical protein
MPSTNMSLYHSLIAVLCSIAITASPVVAAWKPCCCTRPAEKQTNCQIQQTHSTKSSAKACCAKKQPARDQLASPCGCCVKQSQPLDSRSPTIKPVPSVDLSGWVVAQVTPPVSVAYVDCPAIDTDQLSGPPLLALLCRWLN